MKMTMKMKKCKEIVKNLITDNIEYIVFIFIGLVVFVATVIGAFSIKYNTNNEIFSIHDMDVYK